MRYIVFDTEFTSWEGSQENNWSKNGEYMELVQIGALKIEDGQIIDKFDVYIKPKINPILSDYFINLTGITNQKIEKEGIEFIEALERFYKFTQNLRLYSYGNDYGIIKENLKLNKISVNSKFYDLKWKAQFLDFCDLLKGSNIDPTKYSSGTIYQAFNFKLDNHQVHNAFHDTYSLFLASTKIF